MASVTYEPEMSDAIQRLPLPIKIRMLVFVERLRRWPAVCGAKALREKLAGHFRLRTGDYRLQFRVEKGEIVVEKVGHRYRFYEDQQMSAAGKQVSFQIAGKRLVILEQSEYERLCRLAAEAVSDSDETPDLPKPDENGRAPAVEFTRISIAGDIIRARRIRGLSRQALAALAGLHAETIARIESGKHTPSVGTIDKIDWALKQAATKPQPAREPKRGKKDT